MHLGDYNVLLALTEAEGGKMRLGDLARTIVFSPARLTYLMRSLEQRGLVKRSADSDDRRGAYAMITRTGRLRFSKARAVHLKQINDLVLRDLEPEEALVLKRVFARVSEKIEHT